MPLDTAPEPRRFAIQGRLIDSVSFEEAALQFLEDAHPSADEDDIVAVIVEDCASGERQCFQIDLHTGEAAPCD